MMIRGIRSKLIACLCTFFLGISLMACGQNLPSLPNKNDNSAYQPNVSRIRSICELVTLKCTYNNVAKSEKSPGKDILHHFKKKRKFWIAYKGTVTVSYDVSKIQMKTNGNNVTITLPDPKFECDIVPDSYTGDSYIFSEDQFFLKNPITADVQTKAINKAQEDMLKTFQNNSSLMTAAENQAKTIIENYISQLGEVSDVEYKITWKHS